MGGRSPEDISKRKQEIAAALAQTNRELKAAQRQQKSRGEAAARAWKLPTLLAHALLIIYQLADSAAAVKYLVNYSRKRHWPQKPEDEVKSMVEDVFLEADVGFLASLADMENPADAEAMRLALPYIEQRRLVVWATGLNEQHGLAPSTEAVLQRLEQSRARIPERARPPYQGIVADNRGRKWAQQFRRRWGARHGSMKVRDVVPLPELRDKAGSQGRGGLFAFLLSAGCVILVTANSFASSF